MGGKRGGGLSSGIHLLLLEAVFAKYDNVGGFNAYFIINADYSCSSVFPVLFVCFFFTTGGTEDSCNFYLCSRTKHEHVTLGEKTITDTGFYPFQMEVIYINLPASSSIRPAAKKSG